MIGFNLQLLPTSWGRFGRHTLNLTVPLEELTLIPYGMMTERRFLVVVVGCSCLNATKLFS